MVLLAFLVQAIVTLGSKPHPGPFSMAQDVGLVNTSWSPLDGIGMTVWFDGRVCIRWKVCHRGRDQHNGSYQQFSLEIVPPTNEAPVLLRTDQPIRRSIDESERADSTGASLGRLGCHLFPTRSTRDVCRLPCQPRCDTLNVSQTACRQLKAPMSPPGSDKDETR